MLHGRPADGLFHPPNIEKSVPITPLGASDNGPSL
jgi:hypothetical protein